MARLLSAALFLFLLPSAATIVIAQDQPKGGTPDGLKALKDEDPKIRYNSVELLRKLGQRAKFLAPVLHDMLDDPDLKVQLKVAETLWHLDPPAPDKVVPILKTALDGKDAELRGMALSVAQDMGGKAKALLPEVREALKDKDFNLRLRSIFVVGAMGTSAKAAIPELMAILTTDDTGFLEAGVAVALSKIGFSAVPTLRQALTHKNLKVRRGSAYALSLIGRKAYQAVPELQTALEDENVVVRSFAAQALGSIGRDAESAVDALQKTWKAGSGSVRIDAALAVWKIEQDKNVIPVLVESALTEKNYEDRISALSGLGLIGPDAADHLTQLAKATGDDSFGVRKEFCRALVSIGPKAKAAIPELTKLLNDEAPSVQIQAARAIGLLSGEADRKWVAVLESALNNESAPVRKQAVLAMKDLGPIVVDSVPALAKLLRDEDTRVRDTTREAIRAIDPKLAKKIGLEN